MGPTYPSFALSFTAHNGRWIPVILFDSPTLEFFQKKKNNMSLFINAKTIIWAILAFIFHFKIGETKITRDKTYDVSRQNYVLTWFFISYSFFFR